MREEDVGMRSAVGARILPGLTATGYSF
jgi:hypothetical protein